MHFTLTPGSIGLVSLIVSITIFIGKLALRKIENGPRLIMVLFVKARARTRNSLFILSERLAMAFSTKGKIRHILFSENEEWGKILRKSFSEKKYMLDFKDFNDEQFKYYDLVVPLNIPDLRSCIEKRNIMNPQAIPLPSRESVDICDDKNRFNHFMLENGFKEFIPKMEEPLAYPYMLKKNVDEYGRSTFIIEGPADEHMHFDQLTDKSFHCQELVPGRHEYATHIIYKDGKIVSSLNIKYTFSHEYYIKGKDLCLCKEVCHSKHDELFAQILGKIGFEGICCFNYKERDGKPVIFEINPRFGGSLTDFFFSFVRKIDRAA